MSRTAAASGRSLAHGLGALRAQNRLPVTAGAPVGQPLRAAFSSAPLLDSIHRRAQHSVVSHFYALKHNSLLGAGPHCVQKKPPFAQSIFQRRAYSSSNSNVGHKRSAKSPIRAGQSSGAAAQYSPSPQYLQLAQNVAKKLGVALVVAAAIASASLFSLPWVLSTPAGLKTATAIYSATIPGTVSVETAKLEWKQPIQISGVKVSDEQGAEVLTVKQIESEASLWGIVRGKHGLGNTTVQGFRVDFGREETGGEPRALAALTKPQNNRRSPLRTPTETPLPKSADKERPGGCGDCFRGGGARPKNGGGVPIVAAARSEKFRGAVAGAVDVRAGKVHLARPLEADIEINRATGQLFLARLNPLLAGVVGTQNSGQVRVFASPQDMVFPSDQYSLKVDPMTLVLGRGDLVSNALEFLGQKGPGKTLTMRTSAIRATWNAAGRVEAARTDVQIGDKVHLITWGTMDWAQGNVDMVLAIPADTLKVALRVPSVASGYNLQFPLTGSVERPTLDWKAAGKQLAKLVVRQRAPNGWAGILLTDRNDHRALPEPLDPIPWAKS
ncbi:hypothetical protein KFL_008130055 [Klebsormidium nitens]|uniref:Uncharacterized protein n=1 Tax=Klebsormidium nitens TaxID=105231 RepID=A0A1Y1INA1_KLENI|nr:hypothetical protein KFL_008130055 [Klebsormidium nitens]|eukprot:GAQ91592.1 hypothetical protein KFL_008130055 [Klebsormidium nitens]